MVPKISGPSELRPASRFPLTETGEYWERQWPLAFHIVYPEYNETPCGLISLIFSHFLIACFLINETPFQQFMADKVKHTKSSKTSKGTADKKQKNPLSTSPITSATDFSNHCDDTSNFGRNASKAPEAMKMPTLHEPTLKRKVDHPENKEVIAYVHSISPIKRNRKNTLDYFNLKLQTAEDVFPSVCFSRTKRSLFLERQETKTAIKLERFNR